MNDVADQRIPAGNRATVPDPWVLYGLRLVRFTIVLLLLAAIAEFVLDTWRWPLFWDAQVFRYVNFLVAHGWHPYRDIVDMNLPGCYLADNLVVHALGPGDLAWRLYDFILLALLTAAAVVITRPYDWIGGLFAGVQFALYHAIDGPYDAGQRDELLTVLLVCALAFVFVARRHRQDWPLAGFGACVTSAVCIKPTAAPVGLAVLLLLLWSERNDRPRVQRLLAWTAIGAAGPALVVLGYLSHHHAFAALLTISRRITPMYAALRNAPLPVLLRGALPFTMWPAALLWILLLVRALRRARARSEEQFERACLAINCLFGVLSYFIQHKGYAYHRYPLLAFLLLALAFEIARFARAHPPRELIHSGAPRPRPGPSVPATLLLATLVVLLTPLAARRLHRTANLTGDAFPRQLRADLRALGEDRLQHRVQCLDLVTGCLSALYRENLVQSTGMIGDLVLFPRTPSPVSDFYRDRFLSELQRDPPNAIILSDEWYGETSTFDKIDTWPAFAAFLAGNYHITVTRHFKQDQSSAYRLYVRNGFTPSAPVVATMSRRPYP